jgi:transcriptional regulator with XRE-family HTH domain
MRIDSTLSEEALLTLIGQRLAALRLARNLTQSQVAEQAGLGVRTVQRLESGEAATHLSGFLRVCRVLGLLEQMDVLVPEPPVSPMAQLKSHRQTRQRATRKQAAPNAKKKWTWADHA